MEATGMRWGDAVEQETEAETETTLELSSAKSPSAAGTEPEWYGWWERETELVVGNRVGTVLLPSARLLSRYHRPAGEPDEDEERALALLSPAEAARRWALMEQNWRLNYAATDWRIGTGRWPAGQLDEWLGPGVIGLKNLGLTCFANAVLQCLLHTTALREMVCSGRLSRHAVSWAPLLEAFVGLFHAAWSPTSEPFRVVDPVGLLRIVNRRTGLPSGVEQDDAHLFFLLLLESLAADTNLSGEQLEGRGGPAAAELDRRAEAVERAGLPLTLAQLAAKARRKEALRDSSPVTRLFQSWVLSETSCGECGRVRRLLEPEMSLSLAVPERAERPVPLLDCLRAHFAAERLAGWECGGCGGLHPARRRLRLARPAAHLVVQLKRFQHQTEGGAAKLHTAVEVPLELGLDEWAEWGCGAGPEEWGPYRLYAAVAHLGELNAGHYVAAVSLPPLWLGLDDRRPYVLSEHPQLPPFLADKALYLLFYRRL